jgi:tripartite-type tricarboxylate transporter receptor subunit TctC
MSRAPAAAASARPCWPSALQRVKAGKLKALAVTSAKRSDAISEPPTIA